jgi:hypothetical protein
LIKPLLQKDWKLLWPLVALVTAIQIGREWVGFHSGLFRDLPAADALQRPLNMAWFIGIAALAAAVVHQDPIPGVDQDWLIRPLHRTHLLLAKLAFLAITISVPMAALNLADALAIGMPLASSLEAVLFKELFIFACFIVPVAALASATRNMMELIAFGAVLVLVFSLSLSLSAFFLGTDWCPTCHTGMAWLEHLVQHAGVVAGAVVILCLDYYRRRFSAARALALIGAVCLVFVQLPWSVAFAVEKWVSGTANGAAAVSLEFAAELPRANETSAAGGVLDAGRTTQLLLHGHVDQAFESLHRRARRREAPVRIDLPLRIAGVAADELLLVDRSQPRLVADDGRLLYRGPGTGASPGLLEEDRGERGPSGLVDQSIDIPGNVYREIAASTVQLQIEYTLTLMKVSAEHRIPARDGELRSADLGVCETRLDQNVVGVQCKAIGQAPFCFSARLIASDGRRDPEVINCDPDYRRHWPGLIDVLNLYFIELPVRDRYGDPGPTLDVSELDTAYVLLKIYREVDHFKRIPAVGARLRQ